jgi:putative flavoprotein involved in K+ transport
MYKVFDVIIVGAGYSGLCASCFLKKNNIEHIIFEKGKIGESWRSQRWDNFRFNSTNKLNLLPGETDCNEPDAFDTAKNFVNTLEKYVLIQNLPVYENSKVISVEKMNNNFLVKALSNKHVKEYFSKAVLIASGTANEIKIPPISKEISKVIKQFHTSEYKSPDQLPAGAVLVVGGAQSGIQITEDLLNNGKKVFFSTSMVARIPRYYRGRDIFYWVKDAKFYDVREEDIKDPKLLDLRPPHVSGTGDGKTTLSLQSISKRGAIILGKLDKADGIDLFFQNNAAEHVRFADEFSLRIKKLIDEHIEKNNISAPPPHVDEEDMPDTNASCVSQITSLNLEKENINSVIWATGFDHDLNYIRFPVVDEKGRLMHTEGVSDCPGLYFLGFPWMRSRKSPILFGIIEDAEYIVDKILEYIKTDLTSKTSL